MQLQLFVLCQSPLLSLPPPSPPPSPLPAAKETVALGCYTSNYSDCIGETNSSALEFVLWLQDLASYNVAQVLYFNAFLRKYE